MLGYIDVCVNSDSLRCSNRVLKLYIQRRMKHEKEEEHLYICDVNIMNSVIRKLAYNGEIQKIFTLAHLIRKNNIKLNHQTYALILECICRMNSTDNEKLKLLKTVKKGMLIDNISLNDVITKSIFLNDQKSYVDKAAKLLDPNFIPTYEFPDTSYNCKLLQKFDETSATPSSTVDNFTIDELKIRLEKQIEAEINGLVSVKNIALHKDPDRNVLNNRKKLESLEESWREAALVAFKRNLETLKSREMLQRAHKMMLFPYLTVLEPEAYVKALLTEVRNLGMGSDMFSLPYNSLCRQLGAQVFKMYEARVKQDTGLNDKMSDVYLKYCEWFLKRDDKLNHRSKWTILEHEANQTGVTLGFEVPSWQSHVHVNVGRFLFNIIINDLKIQRSTQAHSEPAFLKIYRNNDVLVKEEIKPNPQVSKLYRESQPETLTFNTTLIPSLCPPKPWTSVFSGGFIVSQTDIVRLSHVGNQQWDRLITAPPKQLYPALDSLNQLSSIPWAVNTDILDVAIKVFQNNGSVPLKMPQHPSVLESIPALPKDSDPSERKKNEKARQDLKQKKNEMYSLWCDALYRLSLANHFRNNVFWLPHNMDFRGRVYPVPPHLNHLGSDLARSMLVFALKKPLGPKGLDWLKLHTINLTGFKKKEPIAARLAYADEIMDKILDSAERPLDGEMWWSKSDEPWQTLAACMEISKALKSPNPEEFLSGFPIHQDGSCNGLQHYAALGRDRIGAVSVNLCPSDRPQDVYNSVATMVDEKRREDAANGNQIAKVLEGFVSRKTIKQTVMTTVYGVTWFGAKLQIARRLKENDAFPQQHLWPASSYLVQKTFLSLRTMFKSAREIQDWFTECARLICSVREQNMEWVTPLGLPVVQPYSKIHRVTKKNVCPSFSPDIYRKPNAVKQKNAFAPNFVHSLDSSHMMLTSIYTEHAGITYVSVHDCYWTHPSTVEIMNKICREQFVALHSQPILDDLSTFFVEKFAYVNMDNECVEADSTNRKKKHNHLLKEKLNNTLTKVPQQGDLDLKEVLSSTYFFS
ncbi:DNA-directed RNA polymerase, mitochondrial [Trichogramma pretiosum]|uniref:DNA-directed RNA polymerase, mitochondrial n=1 Tax=Trichogramma pretiosum TaxID=7493 RepID=UPI000C71B916|nr:DNA-directed RNA polymerase, mitochondrial [Trichogramma pretiosum]